MMYLKISLSDYCSVFNSRTRSWCWSRKPHNVVIGAAMLAVTAATFLSAYWPFESGMKGIGWDLILFVWVYVILWSLLQDAIKVLNGKLLAHFGFIEDLGIINEDELEHRDNHGQPTEIAGSNFGTKIDRRPSRRRTTSIGADELDGDSQPLTAGFIQSGFDKNEASTRAMMPQSALHDCSGTLVPGHDASSFNPNIEGGNSSNFNRVDVKGRERHFSIDEEPSHMNVWE